VTCFVGELVGDFLLVNI